MSVYVYTGANPVHPLEVVGYEGIFGLFFSSIVLLPILTRIPGSDCNSAEDTLDTLHMMQGTNMKQQQQCIKTNICTAAHVHMASYICAFIASDTWQCMYVC